MKLPIAETIKKYGMLEKGEPVLVGFSGGADSTALLVLLSGLGQRVFALHVNHGIRGAEAERDEAFCRDFCASCGIPFEAERVDIPTLAARSGRGTEETARDERYRIFAAAAARLGISKIATAHNADDNAETVIHNLIRGTGSAGLCGIPPVRGGIIRPLIETPRAAILAYLTENGLSWVEDSTNAELIYTRNHIRRRILPVMLELNPGFLDTLARDGEVRRADNDYLNFEAQKAFSAGLTEAEGAPAFPAARLSTLHPAIAGRVFRLLYEKAGGASGSLGSVHISAALHTAASDNPSASADLPCGFCARRINGLLCVSPRPSSGYIEEKTVEPGGEVCIPEAGMTLTCVFIEGSKIVYKILNNFTVGCGKIKGNIIIRSRREGDMFRKNARSGRKSLKKLFAELCIPRGRRDLIPVVCDDEKVLAVAGIGASFGLAPDEGEDAVIFDFTARPSPGEKDENE